MSGRESDALAALDRLEAMGAGQARAELIAVVRAALEKQTEMEAALRTIKRRINQYDDMDDATLLAWIEDEADRALAASPVSQPAEEGL